jgi:hypothetical protein
MAPQDADVAFQRWQRLCRWLPRPQYVTEAVLGYGSAEIQQEDFKDLPGFGTAKLTSFEDFVATPDSQWTKNSDIEDARWPHVPHRG